MTRFTEEECDKIISLSESFQRHSSEDWWKGHETKYFAWHITRNTETEWIFQRLFNYIKMYTDVKIVKELEVVNLQNLKTGNKFELHYDKHSDFNIGCCLNNDYDGGELICYNPEVTMSKIKGELYTFYGDNLHEVKQVTRGERWSLIGFFKKGTTENKIRNSLI
jgi:hypothetical protein